MLAHPKYWHFLAPILSIRYLEAKWLQKTHLVFHQNSDLIHHGYIANADLSEV